MSSIQDAEASTWFDELMQESKLRAKSWYPELSQLFQDNPELEDDIDHLWTLARQLPFPLRERFIDPYQSHLQGKQSCPYLSSVFFRSISDYRDWRTCTLENELKKSRDELENMQEAAANFNNKFVPIDGGVTDFAAEYTPMLDRKVSCFPKLLDLIPVDQALWRNFSVAATNVEELISQQRTKYTVDRIREQFRVLYIGHSNSDLESNRESTKMLEDFLVEHDWFDVDLAQQPLCNDIGNFHRDDILENLLEISFDDLQQVLPTNHFDAIVLVRCPAKLRTRSFLNVEALLRPGGFLVAYPARIAPASDIPNTLKTKLAFDMLTKMDADGHLLGALVECSLDASSGRVWQKENAAVLRDGRLVEESPNLSKRRRSVSVG